jgi:hypothetical protein
MSQGEEQLAGDKPKGEDLAPYRRLIELQKQMIELGQQHEQSKRECSALREQVAQEVATHRRDRKGVSHRLRESAVRLLRRVPGLSVAAGPLNVFKTKQPDNGR